MLFNVVSVLWVRIKIYPGIYTYTCIYNGIYKVSQKYWTDQLHFWRRPSLWKKNQFKHDLIDQKARQMRGNIIFHHIPESKTENCAKKVKHMRSKNGYNEDNGIDLIHRFGRFDNNAVTPRPIVAKLTTCSQVNALLRYDTPNHPHVIPMGMCQVRLCPKYILF